MNDVSNVLKKSALLCFGCIVAFFIGELILRIYNPVEFRIRGDRIVLPTNKKYLCHNNKTSKLDRIINHSKNSLGFRGPELPVASSNYLSIITVGGSTTECFYLSDGKTWPDVLLRNLKENCGTDNLWLNNAGMDGHSTFGHRILLEDYIIRLRPKVILFLIGLNDIGMEEFRPYDLNEIKKIQTHSPKEFLLSVCNYSDILSLALTVYRNYKAGYLGLNHRLVDLTELDSVEVSENRLKQMTAKHKNDFISGYERRLKMLAELSKSNGIRPVFITHPALYGDCIDPVTGVNLGKQKFKDNFFRNFDNGKVAWEVMELYNEATRSVGKANDVFVIDLANQMPKNSSYYYDYFHFSNKGAELAGEILAENLHPYLVKSFPEYFGIQASASLN